uniref:Uncharacterized protein n=1 Tax=Geobacter sp. (strain M21) TaxID=443144 RepID=C6E2E4_GEOSM
MTVAPSPGAKRKGPSTFYPHKACKTILVSGDLSATKGSYRIREPGACPLDGKAGLLRPHLRRFIGEFRENVPIKRCRTARVPPFAKGGRGGFRWEPTILSVAPANETAADLRPQLIDAAPVADKKLTPVFDNQLVWPVNGEMEASRTHALKKLVFVPGEVDIGEGAATQGSTGAAAGRIIQRFVQQDSVPFIFDSTMKKHHHAPHCPEATTKPDVAESEVLKSYCRIHNAVKMRVVTVSIHR